MKKIKKFFLIYILPIMFLTIIVPQFVSADEGDIYTVTYNLSGVEASPQEAEIIEGSGLDVAFTPDDGYLLPDEISVQMAGEELSDYIYDNGNLIINQVYGDLVITVEGVPDDTATDDIDDSDITDDVTDDTDTNNSDIYNISYDLYEVTASKQEGNVVAGTRYSVKLRANSGFRLDPLNVAVRVNGDYVANGYSYNEGLLEIDSVDGDIIIEAIAVQKSSSKKADNNTNTNDETNNNNTTTNDKKTNNNTNNTDNSSSSENSNSKSAQAVSNSGGSVQDYNTSSYRAPRTGDTGIDIRYYGALALIFIGAGFVIAGKKYKKDLE